MSDKKFLIPAFSSLLLIYFSFVYFIRSPLKKVFSHDLFDVAAQHPFLHWLTSISLTDSSLFANLLFFVAVVGFLIGLYWISQSFIQTVSVCSLFVLLVAYYVLIFFDLPGLLSVYAYSWLLYFLSLSFVFLGFTLLIPSEKPQPLLRLAAILVVLTGGYSYFLLLFRWLSYTSLEFPVHHQLEPYVPSLVLGLIPLTLFTVFLAFFIRKSFFLESQQSAPKRPRNKYLPWVLHFVVLLLTFLIFNPVLFGENLGFAFFLVVILLILTLPVFLAGTITFHFTRDIDLSLSVWAASFLTLAAIGQMAISFSSGMLFGLLLVIVVTIYILTYLFRKFITPVS